MLLTSSRVEPYLKGQGAKSIKIVEDYWLEDFIPFLQEDYGGKSDCVIVSIAAIIHYLTNSDKGFQNIYDLVAEKAKDLLYKEEKGTPLLTTSTIFENSISHYLNKEIESQYLKNIDFDFNQIVNQILNNNPVMLTIHVDGFEGYYNSHAVVVVGYRTYKVDDNFKRFLCVYDNWTRLPSYVDFDRIQGISTIHYATNKSFNLLSFLVNLFLKIFGK